MILFQFLPLVYIFTLTLHSKIISAVPPDYCLYPLNKSDCGGEPSLVFSYYKPGSRCELETWRGCPTYNKFPDQYLCSHTCVYRIYDSGENKIFKDEPPNEKLPDVPSWEEEVSNLSSEEKRSLGIILDAMTTDGHVTDTKQTTSQEASADTTQTPTISKQPAVIKTTSKLPTSTLKVTTERVTQPTKATTKSSTAIEDKNTSGTDSTTTKKSITTSTMPFGYPEEVIIARVSSNFTE